MIFVVLYGNFRLYLSLPVVPVKCLRPTGVSVLLVLTLFSVGLIVLFPALLKWSWVDWLLILAAAETILEQGNFQGDTVTERVMKELLGFFVYYEYNYVIWKVAFSSFFWLLQVLFHLLDRVRESSTTADKEKIESGGGNILIHHSRDTAEKQWAETWVLTLAGVARIFNTRRYLLQPLGKICSC